VLTKSSALFSDDKSGYLSNTTNLQARKELNQISTCSLIGINYWPELVEIQGKHYKPELIRQMFIFRNTHLITFIFRSTCLTM